jgi:hypothetical protein
LGKNKKSSKAKAKEITDKKRPNSVSEQSTKEIIWTQKKDEIT